MQRRFFALGLLFVVLPAFCQEIDLAGTWDVFPVSELSAYTLKEHQTVSSSALAIGGALTLDADGTVVTDLVDLDVETWAMDEGFLMFVTVTGNIFYWPRTLGEGIYFLVRVDVMELNEQIIGLTSKPQGGLIIIQRQ